MSAFLRDRQALTNSWRSIAASLAFAGMMLRALLPVGWMPAQSLAGGTWLEVCDGMQHHAMPAGMPGMDMSGMAMPDMPGMAIPGMPPAKQKDSAPSIHDICPFAAAAHLAASDVAGHVAAPLRLSWRLQADHGESQRRAPLRRDAHRARAPPLLT